MTRDDQPLPLQRPALPDDDPVAVLAREVGRRAVEAAKTRAQEKAQRRAARQRKGHDPVRPGTPDRAETRAPSRTPPPLAFDTPGEARTAPARRRASSPRGRSTRRGRRRQHTWLAVTVLGAVSVLAVSGLYQLLGRAPAPLPKDAWVIAGAERVTPITSPPPLPRAATPAPVGQATQGPQPQQQAAPAVAATAPTAAPAAPAPTAGPAPRVTTAGRGAPAVLPFIPGSQVVESDTEPQQAPGGGTTWAATLTSQDPVDKAVAYYRQLLSAEARPGGATLTEVTPGPGQMLLSLGNPGDGSHSAVWIGQSDGQVLIRLMRTQGPATTP